MYERRIRRGAAVLDRMRPGWRARVDVDELDVSSLELCVVAQVYDVPWYAAADRYRDALVALGAPRRSRWLRSRWAVRHGFDLPNFLLLPPPRATYRRLTDAWRTYLTTTTSEETHRGEAASHVRGAA